MDWAAHMRTHLSLVRRREQRQAGGTTVRLSFYVSKQTREAIGSRLWDRGRDGPATAAELRDWALTLIFNALDDEARIAECVELDCLDTDDDHDHADGPKR